MEENFKLTVMTQKLIILLVCVIFTVGCVHVFDPNESDVNAREALIVKHWINSYEEESNDSRAQIFRPKGYRDKIPPSHFRKEYIFFADCGCQWLRLAANDAHDFREGFWTLSANGDTLRVSEDGRLVSFKIIELISDLLQMQRL